MKIYGTKKQVARDLWARLQKGPELRIHVGMTPGCDLTPQQIQLIEKEMMSQARSWLASWIIGDVEKLVPKAFHRANVLIGRKEPADGSAANKG